MTKPKMPDMKAAEIRELINYDHNAYPCETCGRPFWNHKQYGCHIGPDKDGKYEDSPGSYYNYQMIIDIVKAKLKGDQG